MMITFRKFPHLSWAPCEQHAAAADDLDPGLGTWYWRLSFVFFLGGVAESRVVVFQTKLIIIWEKSSKIWWKISFWQIALILSTRPAVSLQLKKSDVALLRFSLWPKNDVGGACARPVPCSFFGPDHLDLWKCAITNLLIIAYAKWSRY